MTPDELRDLIHDAGFAFWDVIAKRFPEATTGDLSIDATIRLSAMQEEAVKEWIANNVTTQEFDIPGYRFKLFRVVDRLPDFLAPAHSQGIVTRADDDGVWAHMDHRISGAEQWDNEIHWEDARDFAADTVPE